MGEIHFAFEFPKGELVHRGRISKSIPPAAIDAVIEREPALVHDATFSKYFEMRLKEHRLAYRRKKSGLSIEEEGDLVKTREDITVVEENYPTFQKDLTDHLNSALNKHR